MATSSNYTNENSSVQPIMLRKLPYKRSEMNTIDVVAGLDRGCSLTKIIYVDRADADALHKESTSEFVMLSIVLFPNSEFRLGLEWMRDHGVLAENKKSKIHVTGTGGITYKKCIEEVLNVDILFIDEAMAQARGAFYMLCNVPLKESIYPELEPLEANQLDVPFVHELRRQFNLEVGTETSNKMLPCIFGFMGSGGGFTYLGEDGKFRLIGGSAIAGKTFMGLARCMLGTNNYDEIMRMAERGNRKNVDMQMSDFVDNETNWDFSSTLPIFNMGKLTDTNKSIEEFNKDDLAQSLVFMFALFTFIAMIRVAMSEKVNQVFIGGNLFQDPQIRREFECIQRMVNADFVNFYFLNNGHTGALGAMLSKPDDMEKYYEM